MTEPEEDPALRRAKGLQLVDRVLIVHLYRTPGDGKDGATAVAPS